jgi:putative salt-induced outer membrane protein YdiY
LKPALTSLLALICFSSSARADVVTLKNGDRVTGALVTIKGGTLQLKSDILGNLAIPMAKVATYSVAKRVAVIVKGQEPVQGTLALMPSGDWRVKANGQTRTIAAAKVDTIMPADTYQKLVVVTPKPWQAWNGLASLGDTIQHGDQQTNTFTTTVNMVHERPAAPIFQPHLRTNFSSTTLLAHADKTGNTVTSRTLTANLRQDYLFSPRDFVFGMAQFDHISTQSLYLRQTYGGGFGRGVIQNSRTTFVLTGGVTLQHEKFITGEWDQGARGLVGERLGEQLSKRVRLDTGLNYYPDFLHVGEYRFDTTTVFSVRFSTRLAFNTSFIDLYLSNPPAGNQKNNATFSTGITYLF